MLSFLVLCCVVLYVYCIVLVWCCVVFCSVGLFSLFCACCFVLVGFFCFIVLVLCPIVLFHSSGVLCYVWVKGE